VDLNRIPPVLLQAFLTVAEAGQISEAARRLHRSQPTVTGHIRRLEASFETTLFIRSANGVSLTERGAHLRERVFSCWEIQQEIAMGLVRQINIPGLRIQRMFSWALPSGELGGLPGEFYQFANSIRSELSAVSVSPLKEAA
jgi:DNA-binding transcriptional LysR family regulator